MSVSEIEIINGALLHSGNRSITSLDDSSDSARTAAGLYPGTRDALLRMHPWNFAIKRVKLVQLPTNPPSGFNFYYQLPNDILRMLKGDDFNMDWKREGNLLLSNETSLIISYISAVTDPNLFDALFRETLEHWLASKFALALRNDTGLSQSLEKEYKELLREARLTNALENPMTPVKDDDLVLARRKNIASPLVPWDISTP